MSEMKSAGEIIAEELSGLIGAGAGFVPPAAPQTPAPNPNEAKILRFIRLCKVHDGLTVREVAGGTQLQIADVRTALQSLARDGALVVSGDPDNLGNRLRYNVPNIAEDPQTPPRVYESADQRINRLAEVERDRIRRENPALEAPQAHRVTDEEVTAALLAAEAKRKAIRFTPAERAELDRMQGRLVGLNPQVALVPHKK